jgi:hypothetical protein
MLRAVESTLALAASVAVGALPVLFPVPPLLIGKIPVTPWLLFAVPLKLAAVVLARFVMNVRAVVSCSTVPLVFPVPPCVTGNALIS